MTLDLCVELKIEPKSFLFFWEQINKAFLLFLKIQSEEMGKNISLFGSTFKSIMWSTRSSCWSLKTIWGAIKHDITKFIYCYDSMLSLNELGTSLEDVLQKALEPTSTQRLILCMHSPCLRVFWVQYRCNNAFNYFANRSLQKLQRQLVASMNSICSKQCWHIFAIFT